MEYVTKEYCRENRTKGNGSEVYKCLCPNCGGKDLHITEHNNKAYCFECAAFYRIGAQRENTQRQRINLPIEDIRDFYSNILNFYREALQPAQRQYLTDRGIDDSSIEFFKIGFCSSARIPLYAERRAKESGLSFGDGQPFLSDRIVFPYLAVDKITDLRGRCVNGEEPRYKSPYHQSSLRGAIYPFNYDVAIQRAREQKLLLITEGEIKTIFAHNAGFACVGLPGMTNWRRGCVIDGDIRVVVVFDNTAAQEDKRRVDRAIYNLSRHLPEFSVATLPLLGQDKMDIDTFILNSKGGVDRFRSILDDSIEYTMYQKLRKF